MKRTAVWIFLAMNGAALWFALILADDPSSRADEEQVTPGPTPSPTLGPNSPPLTPMDGGR
jgi:hypothetical protein